MLHDEYFLQLTLAEAAKGAGFCCPNPKVGAVVVKDNAVIATGYHQGFGLSHAEVEALRAAGCNAQGATLYVSLEPCCHFGKTPPCTDAIIQAGIARVVYAMVDSLQHNAHKGAAVLKQAGIACDHIPLSSAVDFYQSYSYFLKNKKPLITAKLAMSQDYKIAGIGGKPLQITHENSRQFTHRMRQASDAILTTVKTIIADNPRFNVRQGEQEIAKKALYVLDRECRLPLDATIFHTTKSITVFHDKKISPEKLQKNNVRCVGVNTHQEKLDLDEVIKQIGEDGVHDVWLEAGATCFHAFLTGGFLQRAFVIQANKRLGEEAYTAVPSTQEWKRLLQGEFVQSRETSVSPDILYCRSC